MKKYYYRNKDAELAWHDQPTPRARLRTLTNTCIEHATLKASDTSTSTLSDALSAPQSAFKSIARQCCCSRQFARFKTAPSRSQQRLSCGIFNVS